MKTQDKAKSCSWSDKLLGFDSFGKSFSLQLGEGKDTLPSILGALCSLTALIVLIIYAGYKFSIMEGKKSVDIVQTVTEDYFDGSYVFDVDQGFDLAIGLLSPFDPTTHKIHDPSFGRLRFQKIKWGLDENGQFSYSTTELESHKCSSEELGLSGTNQKIWPIKQAQEQALKNFQHLFLCVDQSQLAIQGNFSSVEGQVINVDFLKCMGDGCKSDEEIKEFYAGQSLFVLANQLRFDFQKYGRESLIKESEFLPVTLGLWQTRQIFEVSKTELVLQDLAINLDDITGLEDSSTFRLQQGNLIPFVNEQDLLVGVRILMDFNQKVV